MQRYEIFRQLPNLALQSGATFSTLQPEFVLKNLTHSFAVRKS